MKTAKREYRCATCGRVLKDKQWVYSKFTGRRFCVPPYGCQKPREASRKEKR